MSQVLLLQGTALHLPLHDGSVHCVVTSPPFYGLRDYGTGTWNGGDPECTHTKRTSTKEASITTESRPTNTNHEREGWRGGVCGRCGAQRVDEQLGLEASPEAYVHTLVQVFTEVHRVLRDDGTLWLNMGDSYNAAGRTGHGTRIGYKQGTNRASATGQDLCRPQSAMLGEKQLLGMPWRLAFALQADGWVLRSEIIWHKPNPMPESVSDRPTRSHEQVFLFSKQPHYFYDAEAIKEEVDLADMMRRLPYGRASHDTAKNAEAGQGIKSNVSFHAATSEVVPFRNARTVWRIASTPFHGAHFACFPPELARRCLLAGAPSQVCAECGAPWRRVVERQRLLDGHTPVTGAFSRPEEPFRIPPNGVGHWRYTTQTTDLGFAATCQCEAGVAPSVVFDPFCGSGTTLLVARELGHHAVGVDLSWEYLQVIARQRLGLADLAAWEGRERPREPEGYTDLPLFRQEDMPHA